MEWWKDPKEWDEDSFQEQIYEQEILAAELEGAKNVHHVTHFLRDRELGMHGASIRQRVFDNQCRRLWTWSMKRKLYYHLLDEYKKKPMYKSLVEECDKVSEYHGVKMMETSICERYISIGIGQCTKIIIIISNWDEAQRFYMFSKNSNFFKDNKQFDHQYYLNIEKWFEEYDNIPRFEPDEVLPKMYEIVYSPQFCPSCESITCKCSKEVCDVI